MARGMAEVTEPDPYYAAGQGDPLLLLHGLLLTWESWGGVLDELRRDYAVFAPTLPGHRGGPPVRRPATFTALADFVERILDERGWQTAHLAGNSLGGWLALELAARGRARSVTAIAPGGMWDADTRTAAQLVRRYRAFAPVIGVGSGRARAMARSLVIPLLSYRPASVPHRLAAAVAAAPAQCDIVDDLIEDPALPAGFTRFADITVPVTLLYCEHDRVLPPRRHTTPATTATLESRTLPAVGHVPMLEAPTLIAAEIRAATTHTESPLHT
ncbi:pimeloyl-ACP methyl ester carboxylesterase [Nocardia transvalensis]|uniref:Pimeloyl-ACP methyl ester carboxylesterase n=1 Tax=Nocardia transvalensis TaxID=37333 RepID=A0A7W9PE60_9NOCA|nr:alpha/beta fold hydrolase [Nocardia transvalensis]MBB5914018.1 pimeloyl-ACP methyl ester carboxylesterase [Nocardia transvalensis]